MDSTVPEPTTWALLVLGGLGIFGVARKNRKAKK
ncbi:MAG: PEP-CTERM sorting domain-containing protein [Thermoguttaceae bacterium]|nr:PEP-CTERM sorting domain-containing protein [Thermoguttaceae bacterium]